MPILTLHSRCVLDVQEKQRLVTALVDITARELGKDPAVTVVRILDSVTDGEWFVAGQYVDRGQPLYALDIRITQGSNSPEQKDAWLAAVWALLGEGAANLPNYLSIHELPAGQWGYNGISQQRRKEQQA